MKAAVLTTYNKVEWKEIVIPVLAYLNNSLECEETVLLPNSFIIKLAW